MIDSPAANQPEENAQEDDGVRYWRPTRRYLWHFDVVALGLVPLTLLVQGHRFGVGYQEMLIAAIRRIHNQGWLISDWRMGGSLFHPQLMEAIAFLSFWIGEANAFLLAQLLTRAVLLMGVWRLCEALLPGRHWVALVAMAGTVLEPRLQLGYHFLQGGHWEPGFLGMALAVWAMARAVTFARGDTDWTSLAAVSGLAIAAHLFIGLPVAFICILAAAAVRRDWARGAGAFACACLIGSITLIPAMRGFFFPGEAPLTSGEVIQLLQYRHPHHHQPWTWPLGHWIMGAALLGATAYAWWKLLQREDRARLAVPGALLAYFILSSAAFTLAGWQQTIAALAYLQPFRLLSLFVLLAQIAALAWIYRYLELRARWSFPLVGLLALLVLRLVDYWGPLVFSVNLVLLAGMLRRPPEKAALPALAPWVIASVGVLGLAGVLTLQGNPPFRESVNALRKDHWLVDLGPTDPARQELTAWVRRFTHPDATFAIPPDMQGFRIWEERPIVVNVKNVPYTNAELKEWAERLALAGNVDPFHESAFEIRDVPAWQLVLLAQTYGARYVVVREEMDRAMPAVVFGNGTYSVLDLSRADVDLLSTPRTRTDPEPNDP